MQISSHDPGDWCHLCGRRDTPQAEIRYPKNAELDDEDTEYIRICIACAQEIVEGATGVRPEVV